MKNASRTEIAEAQTQGHAFAVRFLTRSDHAAARRRPGAPRASRLGQHRLAALYGLVFGCRRSLWSRSCGGRRPACSTGRWRSRSTPTRRASPSAGRKAASPRWSPRSSERLRENVGDDAIYLVTDAAGRTLDGNLDPLAERGRPRRRLVRAAGRARWRPQPRPGARVRPARRLPSAGRARRAHPRASCARLLTDALFWALFIVIAARRCRGRW